MWKWAGKGWLLILFGFVDFISHFARNLRNNKGHDSGATGRTVQALWWDYPEQDFGGSIHWFLERRRIYLVQVNWSACGFSCAWQNWELDPTSHCPGYSKRSEADAAIQALHNTKPPGLNDFISVKRAKDESGEKSMVHHVIHHYQYPPGIMHQ